jgi:WhiB family redox-sensing transcriptional regulator
MGREVKWPTLRLGVPGFVREASVSLKCGEDPEAFHRARTSAEEAVELCRDCGFVPECLSYAMAHRELGGVWGGTTERERHLRRNRQAQRRRDAVRAVA